MLHKTFQRHITSTRYLKPVALDGTRFGLHGLLAGAVTPEQQQRQTEL
ncbi:MAG: hypothetical protein IPH41_16705 [Sulfuritalea sp.]|nr:hypothetical protein [Sulfuritalea sp.]